MTCSGPTCGREWWDITCAVADLLLIDVLLFWCLWITSLSQSQTHATGAIKRPAAILKDDNDDDDDFVTCPSTPSDRTPPEVVRRRVLPPRRPELEKNVDDAVPCAKSPTTGSRFQLTTSSTGVAAPPSLSAYPSAARILAPPPSATPFQLAAFHSIYASQQQQLRQTHQLPPHLRFSLFTDASSTPGM